MGVGSLDHRVEVTQSVAYRASRVAVVQIVEDRLVVFIHQDHDTLSVVGVGLANQLAECPGDVEIRMDGDRQCLAVDTQQIGDTRIQCFATLQAPPFGKADPDDRIARRPIPVRMDLQPSEQRLVAGKQLGQGIDKQRFPEAPWPRKEIVFPLVDQLARKARFVDIVIVVLTNLAEGLNPDRQFAAVHGCSRQAGA